MKSRMHKRIFSAILSLSVLSLAATALPHAAAKQDPNVTFEQQFEIISKDAMWSYNSEDVLQLKAGDVKIECEDGVLSGAGKDYYPNRYYNEITGNFQPVAGTSNGYIVGMSGDDQDPTAATDITYSMTVNQAGTYQLFLVYDTTDESSKGVSKQAYFRLDGNDHKIPLSKDKFFEIWGIRYLADSITVELEKGTHELVISSGTLNRPTVKSVNADFAVVRLIKAAPDAGKDDGAYTRIEAENAAGTDLLRPSEDRANASNGKVVPVKPADGAEKGSVTFTVNAEDDGMYEFKLYYAADETSVPRAAMYRFNNGEAKNLQIQYTDGWEDYHTYVTLYKKLKKGSNTLTVMSVPAENESIKTINLDCIDYRKSSKTDEGIAVSLFNGYDHTFSDIYDTNSWYCNDDQSRLSVGEIDSSAVLIHEAMNSSISLKKRFDIDFTYIKPEDVSLIIDMHMAGRLEGDYSGEIKIKYGDYSDKVNTKESNTFGFDLTKLNLKEGWNSFVLDLDKTTVRDDPAVLSTTDWFCLWLNGNNSPVTFSLKTAEIFIKSQPDETGEPGNPGGSSSEESSGSETTPPSESSDSGSSSETTDGSSSESGSGSEGGVTSENSSTESTPQDIISTGETNAVYIALGVLASAAAGCLLVIIHNRKRRPL